MMDFINLLNQSSVTFVRDLGKWWGDLTGPGFEAINPWGEVRAFSTYAEAHAWRIQSILDPNA